MGYTLGVCVGVCVREMAIKAKSTVECSPHGALKHRHWSPLRRKCALFFCCVHVCDQMCEFERHNNNNKLFPELGGQTSTKSHVKLCVS